MHIVNVPIEDIEGRYSQQWNKWFNKLLVPLIEEAGHTYATIYKQPLVKDVKKENFLDVVGTNYFKANQIVQLCSNINDGLIPRDEKIVFIIQDGWFPVEQLAYIRDMLGCHDWKFIGIMHAGTYDKWDLTAQNKMYTWGEALENSWFQIYDKIVVASEFHKELLLQTRKVTEQKVRCIPWYVEVPDVLELQRSKKENIVVFPHRLSAEKQPELFIQIADELRRTDWEWIVTMHESNTKLEYYKLLSRAKVSVSLALQETFGIAMVESTLLGCIPLVPDRLSYKEMYTDPFRYSGLVDLKSRLKRIFEHGTADYDLPLLGLQNKFNSQKYFYEELFYLTEEI